MEIQKFERANNKRANNFVTQYLRDYIYPMIVICIKFKMIRHFLNFFSKFLCFWVVKRVKGQKMTQNYKKLCPLQFISQEPYIIWSWFMVHMCKRIISLGVFYIFFQILIFRVNSRVKKQKRPKTTKSYVCCTPYLSKHTLHDHVFCCISLKWWHRLMLFSFFQNFGFLGC